MAVRHEHPVAARPADRRGRADVDDASTTPELEAAEQARELAEERLRDLAFMVADWLWETDTELRFRFVSDSVQQVLGMPPKDVLGLGLPDLMSPDTAARVRQLFQGFAARRARFADVECAVLHLDGSVRQLVLNGVAVVDAQGGLLGFRGCGRDVTVQRRLEAQYLRSQRMECLGALANGIAHDLNNVFAPILMAIDLFDDAGWTADDRANRELLRTSARRGAVIASQLLALSRRSDATPTRVTVRYLLREIGRVVEETFPRAIRVVRNQAPAVWDIRGDATQIHQVLLNLCVNARDAMPRGGTLALRAENVVVDDTYARMNPDARPGRYVRLVVSDTGVGIAPEVLDRLFEPFPDCLPDDAGGGLGLAAVAGLVQSHAGFVEVRSGVSSGSEFRVFLPALDPEPTDGGPVPHTDEPPRPGAGEVVLLVDDEEAVRRVAAEALTQRGFEVLGARDGAEGITCLREQPERVRAAVVDMVMPLLDGVATIVALRQVSPELPIVAISGMPGQESRARSAARERGVVFLAKPFSIGQLHRALTEVCVLPAG